jgi:hypothetical protein
MVEWLENLSVLLFALMGLSFVVAPVIIFLPRLIGSIFSAQTRADFKRHWLANSFLFIATIASVSLFIWLYQKNH